MSISVDIPHLREQGWVCIRNAVPAQLCERLVDVLIQDLNVPVNVPVRWDEYGANDLLPIWGHQAQWDIRQHPNLHRIWSDLWETERLWVSLDSCRFTPPWKSGHAEPYEMHWDHDPRDLSKRFFQGVLALTDTDVHQGGFRCIPSLYQNREAWPEKPMLDKDGDECWLAGSRGYDIVHVPARAGDLIVWDSRLPHGNSKNTSNMPRLAFYVQMHPASDNALQEAAIESWRTGRCVPWWRNRPGYDRTEPWPPAILTALGRKLIGLEKWDSRC